MTPSPLLQLPQSRGLLMTLTFGCGPGRLWGVSASLCVILGGPLGHPLGIFWTLGARDCLAKVPRPWPIPGHHSLILSDF